MLMRTPPPRYRAVSRPVGLRSRRRLLLACLPLSGLLLGLLICSVGGAGVSLLWLTASPETSRITRIQMLQPLSLPVLTPIVLPTAITGPPQSETEPADPAPPPPVATASPASGAPLVPSPAMDDNPAPAVPSAPVASAATPTPPLVTASTPTSLPASNSTPISLPTPTPILIPTSSSDGNSESTDAATVASMPEWWQSYMERAQKLGN